MSRLQVTSAKLALLFVLTSLLAARPQIAARADLDDPPTRQNSIQVNYTAHTWWLTDWQDNQVICSVTVDHEDLPTHPEVRRECGETVYQEWIQTAPCSESLQHPAACRGLYLHYQGRERAEKTVLVDLPSPSVSLSLDGCQPSPPDYICHGRPTLVFTGIEPLPNEEIVAIRGTVSGLPFSCPTSRCELPLRATATGGADIVFWGESSWGDASAHYTARVRVLPVGDGPDLSRGSYVDVLSTQWRGESPASCSMAWDALPPPGGLPEWLTTPSTVDEMVSSQPYTLLAGILISQGLAEADSCPDGGLLDSGAASPCGLEQSRNVVDEWQNRFDQLILTTADARGVPGQLMKNLFAHESQFWPGIYEDDQEVGLGQLTENGADTTLLWNSTFFGQFCPLVLEAGVCASGYAHLLPGEQAMLRGALVLEATPHCPSCSFGIDLTRADFSIDVFAETLLANCEQVGRMVRNTTGELAGRVVEFEDLWRFTIANYNAGPGCLSQALESAWRQSGQLTWRTVSEQLLPACLPVADYVDQVSRPAGLDGADG